MKVGSELFLRTKWTFNETNRSLWSSVRCPQSKWLNHEMYFRTFSFDCILHQLYTLQTNVRIVATVNTNDVSTLQWNTIINTLNEIQVIVWAYLPSARLNWGKGLNSEQQWLCMVGSLAVLIDKHLLYQYCYYTHAVLIDAQTCTGQTYCTITRWDTMPISLTTDCHGNRCWFTAGFHDFQHPFCFLNMRYELNTEKITQLVSLKWSFQLHVVGLVDLSDSCLLEDKVRGRI